MTEILVGTILVKILVVSHCSDISLWSIYANLQYDYVTLLYFLEN